MKDKQSLEQIRQAGLLGAKALRDAAIEKYYQNPNYCLKCGEIIQIKEKQKVCLIKRKKFCDHSCAAQYSNTNSPNRKRTTDTHGSCVKCGETIYYKKSEKTGEFCKRKLCDKCCVLNCQENGQKFKDRIREEKGFISYEVTKGFLYKQHGSEMARKYINRHSRQVYTNSGLPYKCAVCGYDIHIQICHIKGISSFDDDVLVSDINNINNLISFCSNHHWEFDHGLISDDDLKN